MGPEEEEEEEEEEYAVETDPEELDPEDNWPALSLNIFTDWFVFLSLGIPGAGKSWKSSFCQS